jgi:hypothetical protein
VSEARDRFGLNRTRDRENAVELRARATEES